jgi:hypothetical protein
MVGRSGNGQLLTSVDYEVQKDSDAENGSVHPALQ